MEYFLHEVQCAARSLARARVFSLTFATTIGITFGALICFFSLNYLLYVKAFPYPHQERLFVAQGVVSDPGRPDVTGVLSYPSIVHLYKKQQVYATAALLGYGDAMVSNGVSPALHMMETTYVTPGIFSLTNANAQMALGRAFQTSEDIDRHAPAAILSYATWQKEFNGSSDIIGKKIAIDGVSFSVIGVTGPSFAEPQLYDQGRLTKIWLPWDYFPEEESIKKNWGSFSGRMLLIGDLKPEYTVAQANQMLSATIQDRFKAETNGVGFLKNHSVSVSLQSLAETIYGDGRTPALLLFAGAAALMLIACVNVTNLLLSRFAQRQGILGIRASVGATPQHLFYEIFIETMVLTGLSTLFALIFAQGGVMLLQQYAQKQIPRVEELSIDLASLIFAVLVALMLAGVFASIVSRAIDYRSLITTLQGGQGGGKGVGFQISRFTRNALITAQVALAAMLLAGNIELLQTSIAAMTKPSGMHRLEDTYHLRIDSGAKQLSSEQEKQMALAIKQRLSGLPEVESAGSALFSPLDSRNWTSMMTLDPSGEQRITPHTNVVDERFFDNIGLPVAAGRTFKPEDITAQTRNIVVNASLASALAPDGGAWGMHAGMHVGMQVFWQGEAAPYRIIGIVQDVHVPGNKQKAIVYLPGVQGLNFLVKLKPHQGQTMSREKITEVLATIDRNLRVIDWKSTEERYLELLARDIASAGIAFVLAALALFLAAVGIYGVLSYSIKLRRHQFGICMAIGATPGRIAAEVLVDSFRPISMGLALSLIIGWVGYETFRDFFASLFTSVEVTSLMLTAALILFVAAFASLLPLRSIISQQPVMSLRYE